MHVRLAKPRNILQGRPESKFDLPSEFVETLTKNYSRQPDTNSFIFGTSSNPVVIMSPKTATM